MRKTGAEDTEDLGERERSDERETLEDGETRQGPTEHTEHTEEFVGKAEG